MENLNKNQSTQQNDVGILDVKLQRRSFLQYAGAGAAVVALTAVGCKKDREMRGTRLDGSVHLMRGVVIFGVEQERIVRARFYLEPAQDSGGTVEEFVRSQVGAP